MNNTDPEISIIVPVYNVEQYLRQCLDSIENQTFTDWECIVVDDESPDGSAAIIAEYVDRDQRFKVIHRKNGGLSAARNSGLEAAKGRYIGFVDADDWIEPQMFQELHRLITRYDADMAQVGFIKEYKGISHNKTLVDRTCVISHNELVKELFYDKTLPSYVWNKLFRREVIVEPFPEGKVFEDLYILSHWIRNIRSGVFSPFTLYHYRYRKGSIAHAKSVTNRLQYFEACIERAKTLDVVGTGMLATHQRDKILWKAALGCAKVIGRMTNVPKAERVAAVKNIIKSCDKYLSRPDKETLGLVRYHKAQLMRRHPARYMVMSVITDLLDLHSRYRKLRAYD